MNGRQRCGAKKRDGTPCKLAPMLDATRCRLHGGKSPRAQAKAAERRQQAQALKALGDVPTENVDPAEALLGLVTAKWAETQWLRNMVRQLEEEGDADSLIWGQTQHDVGIGPEGPIDKRVYQAGAHVWWKLLREAEDQLARYSSAALKAGVERRQIELQEAQALHLAHAITRILDALELTTEQARKVPEIVPQVLRALPIGESK